VKAKPAGGTRRGRGVASATRRGAYTASKRKEPKSECSNTDGGDYVDLFESLLGREASGGRAARDFMVRGHPDDPFRC